MNLCWIPNIVWNESCLGKYRDGMLINFKTVCLFVLKQVIWEPAIEIL